MICCSVVIIALCKTFIFFKATICVTKKIKIKNQTRYILTALNNFFTGNNNCFTDQNNTATTKNYFII